MGKFIIYLAVMGVLFLLARAFMHSTDRMIDYYVRQNCKD